MKIHVEGHEIEVLQGMDQYLLSYKPTLLIEILTDSFGAKIQEILKYADYLYFNLNKDLIPILQKEIIASQYHNYLICLLSVAKKN
ncbi:hypothetical protein ACS5NO_03680 [Larkinella sp. GY13]|uniref:hypothetical protein n=1 Tax=Larkinella sp. GY13 TaxID=3453720 RepID=UPI003EE84AFB